MSKVWRPVRGLSLLALMLLAVPALRAGGYLIREHSTAALGSAFAGVHAGAHDLADIFFNPANLMRSTGRQAWLGANVLSFRSTFRLQSATNAAGGTIGGNPGGGNIAPLTVIPALYTAWDAGSNLRLGLAVNAPWGLRSEQNPGWVGRYHALDSELKTLNITPMAARRVGDSTVLALGLQFQQAEATLENDVDFGLLAAQAKVPGARPSLQDGHARISGDDWGNGFLLGLAHEVGPRTRFGLSYRSQVRHTLRGSGEFTLDTAGMGAALAAATGAFRNTGVRADLNTPAVLGFGVLHQAGGRWTLLFDAVKTCWSGFEELRIRFDNPAQPDAVTREEWRDTWFWSLGGSYRASDRWTWRIGFARDEGPVEDHRRIPRLPTAGCRFLGLGATCRVAAATTVDGGVTFVSYDDSPIRLSAADPTNRAAGNLVGAFDTRLTIYGLSFQHTF